MMNGINAEDQKGFRVQPVPSIRQLSQQWKQIIETNEAETAGEGFDQLLQSEMEKLKMKDINQVLAQGLIKWTMEETYGVDMRKYNPEIAQQFIPQILRKRLKAAEIDIVLPDIMCLMITLCTDGNPGQSLMILSDILQNKRDRDGKIPAGYIITAQDFTTTFPLKWPIMFDPEISEQYRKKWDAQKRKPLFPWETDNQIDMVGWWRKFVE